MQHSPLTLEALLVLDAIDQRGSFASAAEQLNKVPSAISYIVQKLEEQLGVTLFVRQGRRSVLTPAGVHLLEEGRKVLLAVGKLTEQTQTIAHGWEPKIRIAIDTIVDERKVFRACHTFLAEHENIELDFKEEVLNGTWEALIEDEVDLVIGASDPVPVQQGIRAKTLTEYHSAFVAAPDHPLHTLSRDIQASDILKYRTVVVHDSSRNAIAKSSNIIEGSKHLYVSNLQQKICAIEAGVGVGFLPVDQITSQIKSGTLKALTLAEPSIPQSLNIAWKVVNKGKGLRALVECIETEFSK